MIRKIGILANPHGGYQRDTAKSLARCADGQGTWELRHRVIRPGNVDRLAAWGPHAIVAAIEPQELLPVVETLNCVGICLYTPVPSKGPLYSVTADYADVAKQLTRLVSAKGYRSLTLLHADHRPWTDEVLRHLQRIVYQPHQPAIEAVPCGPSENEWRDTIRAYLNDATFPLAVAGEPELARDCCDLCREMGIAVPEQVAICSLDDNELICGLTRPAVTAIRFPGRQAGRVISDLLTRRFNGETVDTYNWSLPTLGITERRSTEISAINDPLVARAIALMRERADQRLQVSDLLRMLGVSRRVLEKRFQAAVACSPYAQITRMRTAVAKRRLRDSDMSIAKIASLCGYADIYQFSRDFKRATGLAPSHWRANAEA